MEFIEHLKDLFPDTVTVILTSEPDQWGNTTVISQQDLPARVTGKIKTVKDVGGNEVTSSVQAVFPGVYGLTTAHRYVLPPRFEPRDPKPISVGHATDEEGAEHERVFFYWTQVG